MLYTKGLYLHVTEARVEVGAGASIGAGGGRATRRAGGRAGEGGGAIVLLELL